MTESEQNLIEIRDLHFSRGDRKNFDGINMDIRRGQITAIMGPSACGKTTLLRLLGAQLKPNSGNIWLGEKNIPTLKRKELFEVRKQIGMLFQSGALFSDLNIYENVAFPLRVHTDLPDDMIHDLVLMKLHAVGLRGARDLMPSELSGGMARRAALARAIALDPEIIMYDEPFAGQDPISMGVLVRLIRLLNKAIGITSIIVSHDLQETASIADYIYIIADGKVIGEGTPEQVMTDRSAKVHQFTHGTSDGPVPFHFPAPEYSEDIMDIQNA